MEEAWNFIQVVCSGIVVLGGAGAVFVGLYRWFKKPDINRDKKIREHDIKLDNDFERLKEIEKKQAETDEAMKVLMKSMLALMSQAVDGNNINELKKARDDMQEFLIRR